MINNKIYTIKSLVSEITSLKSEGRKIILCHGVFDLLHIGHIKYLKEAKSMGNVLVVTITPDRFVSVAGASFHNLSYQQARLYAVACKGVFVCEATGSFRFESTDNGWIIQTVDHKKTPDLDSFIEVMKGIPDRSRVVVTYKHLRDLH